jgi:hypothetical protein
MAEPIDTVPIVLSGLGAAIIGALIGSGISLASQARERHERRRHAARAVQDEVARNATLLTHMAKHGLPMGPILTGTWRQHVVDIAGLLTKEEFAELAATYLSADEAEERRVRWPGGVPMGAQDREFFGTLGHQFFDVVKILDRRAW